MAKFNGLVVLDTSAYHKGALTTRPPKNHLEREAAFDLPAETGELVDHLVNVAGKNKIAAFVREGGKGETKLVSAAEFAKLMEKETLSFSVNQGKARFPSPYMAFVEESEKGGTTARPVTVSQFLRKK
jgi:hypothetical protein